MKTPPCAAHDADTEQELLREDLEATEAGRRIQEAMRPESRNVGNYQTQIIKSMKKHELIKEAYDRYPAGTVATWGGGKFTSTGTFNFEDGYITDENGHAVMDYYNGKWAEIIPEASASILTGKCAIQVNNEREFKLLMEHYESKGWKWNGRDDCSTIVQLEYPTGISYEDYFMHGYKALDDDEYELIAFSDFAKEVGVTVPVFVMKSEDGVDLYEGDDFHYAYRDETDRWRYQQPNRTLLLQDATSTHLKHFSTKEAGLTWVGEQNKPKKITIPCTGGEVVVGKLTVTFNVAANREFSSIFFDKIVEAYQSLQS